MRRRFYRFLFFRVMGWKSLITVDMPSKCVVCEAPHTSNWDLLVGKVFALAHGFRFRFLIKEFWYRFPMSLLIRPMGGISVSRDHQSGMVSAMADLFRSSGSLILAVTPEGTRKPNKDWKKGFYYIALEAGIPILLVGLDYKTKTVFLTRSITPCGDYESDILDIKQYFSQFTGRNPENFLC